MEEQPCFGPSQIEKAHDYMDMLDEILECQGDELKIAEILRFYRLTDRNSQEAFVRALATHLVREHAK